MLKKLILASIAVTLLSLGSARAGEGPVPKGIPILDHVFVIMMEKKYLTLTNILTPNLVFMVFSEWASTAS